MNQKCYYFNKIRFGENKTKNLCNMTGLSALIFWTDKSIYGQVGWEYGEIV